MHMRGLNSPRVAIITPSYRNDLELAIDLCTSIDSFVNGDYEHIVVVPQRDLALFKPLESARRRVVSENQLLRAYGMFPLPLPTRLTLPFIKTIKFRQQWWCRGVGRISGWVTQQIIKLSAVNLTSAPLLMFIDSDVILFRSLDITTLLAPSGASYLHQTPMLSTLTKHRQWYETARNLLKLNKQAIPSNNYIGNLIVWRAAAIKALHAKLADLHQAPWQQVVARAREFSEYILYGVYASEVHAIADAHVYQCSQLTCSIWTSNSELVADHIARAIKPEHVALHLQSTLRLPIQERRQLCRQAIEHVVIRKPHHKTARAALA